MSTYHDILVALDNLEYEEQLQIAVYIMRNLGEAIRPEEEEVPESFRKTLPRLGDLYHEDFVRPGDVVYLLPKKTKSFRDQFAVLVDENRVRFQEELMSINEWARRVYDYKGVNIYKYVMHERENCTLGELRERYIKQFGLKDVAEE